MYRSAALTLCLAWLVGGSAPGFGATRRAVLIGINQYNPEGGQVSAKPPKASPSRKGLTSGDVRHWVFSNLDGAINDVNLIEGLLLAPDFGFQPGDIVKLTTPETTTADAILTALRREVVETAAAGDLRLVYYSGHGNFIRNAALKTANAKAGNEFDQTIVPSDHWQGAVDVRDKELSAILWDSAKKGVTVTFIADSCHSGSLTRGPLDSRGRSRSNSGVRGAVDGVAFGEPLIDDPPRIDPATGRSINPEEAGVLTLAAAQENQEALELRTEKDETHGGMTMSLVRAIREEGPHASMNHIFERMWSYMQAANLPQTPVMGGRGRGDRDLLGEPARQEPFSVVVRQVRGDEAVLRGGEAIGLFAGSELRQLGGAAGSQAATLTVDRSMGLAESVAKISPPGAAVALGDRFEVTKWAAAEDPNLRVYVPPSAKIETIRQIAESLAPLRSDPSITWVDDPTMKSPTDILRWNSSSWVLDHLGAAAQSSDLGASPSAADVKRKLASGARFFVMAPPAAALSTAIGLGEGTRYLAIQKLPDAGSGNADYRLCGRLADGGVQYAWVRADAKRAVTGEGPAAPMPLRTDWVDAKADGVGNTLTEYAVRIGKVHAWLTLSGRPGQTAFPYHLVLHKPGSDENLRATTVYGGEQYKMLLQLDPEYQESTTARRWVYVFAISQQGKGTLLFPPLGRGNEGNHLPRAEKDERPKAPAAALIRLLDQPYDLEISEPWGTDTYIVISTRDAIPNPGIFEFDGVQTSRGAETRGAPGSPLEDLLGALGNSTRAATAARSPSEWSIERITLESAKKQ
jgi:Caspase domain